MNRRASTWETICEVCIDWFNTTVEDAKSCKECGNRVEFFADVCECCGQGDPARLPFDAGMVLFVFPSLLAMLYIVITL